MNWKRYRCLLAVIIISFSLVVSCGGPEQKKMKFLNKGMELYEKGDYVKAALEFKNAIQIDPKFDEAYYMLGMVELQKGNPREAYGNFSKAVELAPGNLKAQVQIGKIMMLAGDPAKAMEKADLVLNADPKSAEAVLLKGSAYLALKKPDQAREYLESRIKEGFTTPDIYLALSSVYRVKADVRGEERVLEGRDREKRGLSQSSPGDR